MKPDHAASRSPAPLRGIGIMLCACLLFPAGDAIAKYLTGTHHVLMILWFKYVFQSVAVIFVVLLTMPPAPS